MGDPLAPEAIAAFKEQLGVHANEDATFGWIAEVGLRSPLPPRWTSHADEGSGFIYYVDHDRQASSWENPLVPHLRRIVEIGRAYLRKPIEGFFDEQKGILWHQHKHDLDAWHGPFLDGEGRQYFVNPAEEVSSWEDPRVDAQYIFELESGLLASLEEVLPAPMLSPEDEPWFAETGAEVLTIDAAGATPSSTKTGFNPLMSTTSRLRGGWRRGGSLFGMGSTLGSTVQLKSLAAHDAKKEHTSTLEQMSSAAKHLQGLQQDEDEAQRLALARRVEERRRRRQEKVPGGGGSLAEVLQAVRESRPRMDPSEVLAAMRDRDEELLRAIHASGPAAGKEVEKQVDRLRAGFDLAPVLEAVEALRPQVDQAPVLKAVRENKTVVDFSQPLEEIRRLFETLQASTSAAPPPSGDQERNLRHAVEELKEAVEKARDDKQVMEELREAIGKAIEAAERQVDLSPLVSAIQEIRVEVDNSEVLEAIRESGARPQGSSSLQLGEFSSASGQTSAMLQEISGLRADVAQLARLDFAPLAAAIRASLRADLAAACGEDLQRLQLEVSGLRNLDFSPLINAINERSAEVDFSGVLAEIERVKQDVASLAAGLRLDAPRPTLASPGGPAEAEGEAFAHSSAPD